MRLGTMARLGLLLTCATLGAVSPALSQEKKVMSATDMWGLKRLSPPALSPDGKSAVVTVSVFDLKTDKRAADLWLFPVDGGPARQLTTDPAAESDAVWSPDGKYIAFIARRDDDKAPQLYILPVGGGEAKRVTAVPTGVRTPKWLPDGRGLVFMTRVWTDLSTWDDQAKRLKEQEESKMTAKVWDKAPIAYFDRYLDDRENHLYATDIDGAAPRAITLGSGVSVQYNEGSAPFDISPDDKEIAFPVNVDKVGNRPNTDLFTIAVTGGQATNLTPDNTTGPDSNPAYSPDGKYLAYAKRTIYGFYGENAKLIVRERATGAARDITEGFDRSAGAYAWTSDSSALYGAVDDASVQRVYRYDPKGKEKPRRVTDGSTGDVTDVEVAGKSLVGLRQSISAPAELVAIEPKSGKVRDISAANAQAMAGFHMGKVESVTYKGANNADIQMWVVYPPDFDPSKKYPAMMLVHGGPHNAISDAFSYRWNAQVFAGWGYVVTWHNFHGSSGFGQAFTDSINPEWGEVPYQDTMKAADWLAAKPFIDKDRMLAAGASYGGYLTSFILGREHPFKTLVIHAAVYNLYTQYAADFSGSQARFKEFWDDQDNIARNSPHMQAGNFKTPTLVLHGEQDLRVPINHGIELFNTLQRRGVESRLVYFPDENHWVLKPQNSVFWYGEVERWVKAHVKPGPSAPGM
ncbi:S9 family peptidase [Niveispirillum sp.]|uniref:S9 family peptidase n=1 Tax=Niveispirillum sp. TaxID=1917217 RepID=UPI001B41C9CB|nr:S9 family peptidase [Niveispirillum sp.]MBP7340193.1 S9 family peptidase [Niveispirillum sp.]